MTAPVTSSTPLGVQQYDETEEACLKHIKNYIAVFVHTTYPHEFFILHM